MYAIRSYYEQAEVTLKLLNELGCKDIPVVTVLNKCDIAPDISEFESSPNIVKISAKNATGLEKLLEVTAKTLPQSSYRMKIVLPYDKAGLINKIREEGKIFSEEYVADGIAVVV